MVWRCKSCTYDNDDRADTCDMCGSARERIRSISSEEEDEGDEGVNGDFDDQMVSSMICKPPHPNPGPEVINLDSDDCEGDDDEGNNFDSMSKNQPHCDSDGNGGSYDDGYDFNDSEVQIVDVIKPAQKSASSIDEDSDGDFCFENTKFSVFHNRDVKRKRLAEDEEQQTQKQAADRRNNEEQEKRIEDENRHQQLQAAQDRQVDIHDLPQFSRNAKKYTNERHNFALKIYCLAMEYANGNYHQRGDVTKGMIRMVNFISCGLDQLRPILSLSELKRFKGIGDATYKNLEKCELLPLEGADLHDNVMLLTPGSAALLVLNECEEGVLSFPDLISRVNNRLAKGCRFRSTETSAAAEMNFALEDTTDSSVGHLCIKELGQSTTQHEAYLKFTKKKKIAYVEITAFGRSAADNIRRMIKSYDFDGRYFLRQYYLKSTLEKFRGGTVCIDNREGGGVSHHLHELCDRFQEKRCPYFTASLKVGDYVLFLDGKVAPYIIERKSLVDVARSISDGSWSGQKKKMRKAQFVLCGGAGGERERVKMIYIIEGRIQDLTLIDKKWVGQRAYEVTIDKLKEEVKELEQEFRVIVTQAMKQIIVDKLLEEAISDRNRNGVELSQMTYQEFKDLFDQTDDKEGEPPPRLTPRKNPYANVASSSSGGKPNNPYAKNPYANVASSSSSGKQNPYAKAPILTPSLISPPPLVSDSFGKLGGPPPPSQEKVQSELREKYPIAHTLFSCLSTARLKNWCVGRTVNKSGSKAILIPYLLEPALPKIIVDRKKVKDAYVPRLPGSTAALLCVLLAHPGEKMTKDQIMHEAEQSRIRGEKSMYQENMNRYDGWAGMTQNLVMNNYGGALVHRKKQKFELTDVGKTFAKAVHIWAHNLKLCRCSNHPDSKAPEGDSSDIGSLNNAESPFTMCKEGRFVDLKQWADTDVGKVFDFNSLDEYGLDCLYYVARFGGEVFGSIDEAMKMFKWVQERERGTTSY